MKRKFLVVLLAVVTTLCMVFGFAGCSLSDLFGGKDHGLLFTLNPDGESYTVSKGELRVYDRFSVPYFKQ